MKNEPSSFRDRAGFVFESGGDLFRSVESSYSEPYGKLKSSGLWARLQSANLLVDHEEIPFSTEDFPSAIAMLKPRRIETISYPYEWCFSQLKDAALLTLKIQRISLESGMSLRDASAYNIQFSSGRPILIDTLSFEEYREGDPWVAYGQFCRHFLAPLTLMAYGHRDASKAAQLWIDGIPLDVASRLAAPITRYKPGLQIHLHLHARAQSKHDSSSGAKSSVSRIGQLGLIDSLERTIESLRIKSEKSTWSNYYSETNYSESSMEDKQRQVASTLNLLKPKMVWDIGANTGSFSKIAADSGAKVVAWDMDSASVEEHYLQLKRSGQTKVLPLVCDLANPSPSIGWNIEERKSFFDRANADTILALALVHHLAIGNNVPLPMIAAMFARLGPNLIVEFIPKSDSQVQRMLATRDDIFSDYSQSSFEEAIGGHFTIDDTIEISGTDRLIYRCKRLVRA